MHHVDSLRRSEGRGGHCRSNKTSLKRLGVQFPSPVRAVVRLVLFPRHVLLLLVLLLILVRGLLRDSSSSSLCEMHVNHSFSLATALPLTPSTGCPLSVELDGSWCSGRNLRHDRLQRFLPRPRTSFPLPGTVKISSYLMCEPSGLTTPETRMLLQRSTSLTARPSKPGVQPLWRCPRCRWRRPAVAPRSTLSGACPCILTPLVWLCDSRKEATAWSVFGEGANASHQRPVQELVQSASCQSG